MTIRTPSGRSLATTTLVCPRRASGCHRHECNKDCCIPNLRRRGYMVKSLPESGCHPPTIWVQVRSDAKYAAWVFQILGAASWRADRCGWTIFGRWASSKAVALTVVNEMPSRASIIGNRVRGISLCVLQPHAGFQARRCGGFIMTNSVICRRWFVFCRRYSNKRASDCPS